MPFSIEYKKAQNYYRLSHSGIDSLQDYLNVKTDLLAVAGAPQPKINVLVTLFESPKTNMTKKQQFELIEHLNDGSLLNMKIALVVPKAPDDQNDWYFVVEIARGVGIKVKPFYTEDKALDWLLDS